jgi:hypothetical protein
MIEDLDRRSGGRRRRGCCSRGGGWSRRRCRSPLGRDLWHAVTGSRITEETRHRRSTVEIHTDVRISWVRSHDHGAFHGLRRVIAEAPIDGLFVDMLTDAGKTVRLVHAWLPARDALKDVDCAHLVFALPRCWASVVHAHERVRGVYPAVRRLELLLCENCPCQPHRLAEADGSKRHTSRVHLRPSLELGLADEDTPRS